MTPDEIAKILTDTIYINNGLICEHELVEAVSYIELTNAADKLPQGQIDDETAEAILIILGNIAGFANMVQAQTNERPKHIDDLFRAYGNILAKLGIDPKVHPKEMKMNIDEAKPYFIMLLKKLAKVTSLLSARARFKDVHDKSVFSGFVTKLTDRVLDPTR